MYLKLGKLEFLKNRIVNLKDTSDFLIIGVQIITVACNCINVVLGLSKLFMPVCA